MRPVERGRFVRDLFEYGVYVLPCGGGVISEPRHAIFHLRRKYGKEGLCRGCLELIRNDDDEWPEGVYGTAWHVVCRLADEAFLDRLLAERRDKRLDRLIAALCHRLKRPLPEGIAPLTEKEIQTVYSDEDERPLTEEYIFRAVLVVLCLIPLAVLLFYVARGL